MANLSSLHLKGCGGAKRDLVESCTWMEKYINSDSPERDPKIVKSFLYNLGTYLLGAKTDVRFQPQQELPIELQDAKKACQLLERAGGDIFNCMDSIKMLGGMLYMTGQHPQIPQDLNKGMYWLMRGAQNKDGHSAYLLAMAFKCGLIPVNEKLVIKWLQIADKLGYAEAKEVLASVQSPILSQEAARKRLRNLKKEKGIEGYLMTDQTTSCSNRSCNNVEENELFLSCKRCKQVKYCSKKCQTIHWKHGGHKDNCSTKGKEEAKEYHRNIALPVAKICFNSTCSKKEKEGAPFSICSSCKAAVYCSRDCQIVHYRNVHKKVCKTAFTYFEEANKILTDLK